MAFEDLTLVPIQTKMIDVTLLTPAEEQWLNNYHRKVELQCLNDLAFCTRQDI